MESLKKTRGYNISKNHSSALDLFVFLFIIAFMFIFNLFIIGSILAVIITIGFHYYMKKTYPGEIKHTFQKMMRSKVLYGNKKE